MALADLIVRIAGDVTGLTASLGEAQTKVAQFGTKTESSLSGIAKMAGFAAIGAAAYSAAIKFEDASNTIRRTTGATGDKLKELEGVFQSLYVTSAKSADVIAGALSKVAVETRLHGPALEALTRQYLAFAKVTGSDVQQAVQGNLDLFKNWNVAASDQAAAMDTLYRVQQLTGISTEKLTSGMREAGPALRTMGFSFAETAALLGTFEEKGVNAGEVMSTLSRIMARFAKSTDDPKAALLSLIEHIKNAASQTDALGLAAGAGGRPGAGLVLFVDTIRRGAFDTKALNDELAKSTDTVGQAAKDITTLRETLTKAVHQLESFTAAHQSMILALGLGLPAVASLGAILGKIPWGIFASGVLGWAAVISGPLLAGLLQNNEALTDLEKKWKAVGTSILNVNGEIQTFTQKVSTTKEYLDKWTPESGKALTIDLPIKIIPGFQFDESAAKKYAEAVEKATGLAGVESDKKILDLVSALRLLHKEFNDGYLTVGEWRQALLHVGEALEKVRAAADIKIALLPSDNFIDTTKAFNAALSEVGEGTTELSGKFKYLRTAAYTTFEDLTKGVDPAQGAIDRLTKTMDGLQGVGQAQRWLDTFIPDILSMTQNTERATNALDDLRAQFEATLAPALRLQQAHETLGIEMQTTLVQNADKLWQAFQSLQEAYRGNADQIYVLMRAERAWLEASMAAGTGVGVSMEYARQRVAELDKALGKVTGSHAKVGEAATEMARTVRKAFDHIAQGIAGLIVDGGKFKDILINIARDIAKGILEIIVKVALAEMIKHLGFVLDKIGAIGKAIKDWGAAIGSIAKSTAGQAAGVGAGGGVSATADVAGSAAGAGAGAIVNMVTGAISAVTGIIGVFQQARQENTLNAIEWNTRKSSLHLEHILVDSLLPYLPNLAVIADFLWKVQATYLQQISVAVQSIDNRLMGGRIAGMSASSSAVTINVYGGDARVTASEVMRALKLASPAFA